MTEGELIEAGYRKCAGNGPWSGADCFFQKRFREAGRTLYFLNVGMWDFRQYALDAHVGWEAEAHFYRGEDRSFRLHVPIEPADTIADVEAIYREFFDKFGCVPDIHNQD